MQNLLSIDQKAAIAVFEGNLYNAYVNFLNLSNNTGLETRDREKTLYRYLLPSGRQILEHRYQESLLAEKASAVQ